jgi:hypothetical protein
MLTTASPTVSLLPGVLERTPMTHDLAYLQRAFSRLIEEAVQSAQTERQRVMAKAAQRGNLQSGSMLLLVKAKYDRAASETVDKMVRLAFDLTGSTAEPVCDGLRQGLNALRDSLSNDLAELYRSHAGWAPSNVTDGLGNDFLNVVDRRIAATIDDFAHGIAGGTRMTKDPLVNIISTISDSPGAVLQAGIGNVQRALTSGAGNIQTVLTQFVNSKEVQELTAENKQSLTDMAEVLGDELKKPQPDASKISRWGKRLVDIAERLGIGVAASGLSHILFG